MEVISGGDEGGVEAMRERVNGGMSGEDEGGGEWRDEWKR